jgi:hypothetical protein
MWRENTEMSVNCYMASKGKHKRASIEVRQHKAVDVGTSYTSAQTVKNLENPRPNLSRVARPFHTMMSGMTSFVWPVVHSSEPLGQLRCTGKLKFGSMNRVQAGAGSELVSVSVHEFRYGGTHMPNM